VDVPVLLADVVTQRYAVLLGAGPILDRIRFIIAHLGPPFLEPNHTQHRQQLSTTQAAESRGRASQQPNGLSGGGAGDVRGRGGEPLVVNREDQRAAARQALEGVDQPGDAHGPRAQVEYVS
jgi:hypothetical protein